MYSKYVWLAMARRNAITRRACLRTARLILLELLELLWQCSLAKIPCEALPRLQEVLPFPADCTIWVCGLQTDDAMVMWHKAIVYCDASRSYYEQGCRLGHDSQINGRKPPIK